jgi:D-lactate dehydrogenase (cytochrome)
MLTGDAVAAYLQDAAHTPGGHTPGVALPRSEGEVAWLLRECRVALPIGAQSSLTGGATPFGTPLLSLARMDRIRGLGGAQADVEAGVVLLALEETLRERGLFFPPAPTFRGATVGGAAATNAAGAATFKYGSTRRWVLGLSVVLAGGDVLEIERGECRAHPDGYFELELADERVRLPLPSYRMPDVPKRSAGYHAEPEMDLVDLFVGSEGTLGVITSLRLGLAREPQRFSGWLTLDREAEALALTGRLRAASLKTWSERDPRGIDVAAIELLDGRCLELLRADGNDRLHGVRLAPGAEAALLFQAELPPGTDAGIALDQLGSLGDGEAEAVAAAERPDTPLTRLGLLLREAGALDRLEVALPGDTRRAAELAALREAVPLAVNHLIGSVQRSVDPQVRKTATDMIVPFERLPEMMARYREAFGRRNLDHAIFGHVSDGNLHANVLPRSAEDVRRGEEAILELGDTAIALGGCPLSEHGVGRSPVKQQLLRALYGDEGITAMRRVKAALDPHWKLAPGVLFAC